MQEYSEILEELDIHRYVRSFPWIYVGHTSRIQGWKIHLSSINIEAVELLRKVVPYLVSLNVCFKVIQNSQALTMLNEGDFGDTQIGKFMTIYPDSDLAGAEIAKRLVELTKEFHGPKIVTDIYLGGVVYTRYGSFNPIIKIDKRGIMKRMIYTSDGQLIPDEYHVPPKLPKDIDFPFVEITIPQPLPRKLKIAQKYIPVKLLKYDPTGSVFLVIDVSSQESVSLKVIKQAKAYTCSDDYGRDARDWLKAHHQMYTALKNLISTPKVYQCFEEDGDCYLVLEYLRGKSFFERLDPWLSLNRYEREQALLLILDLLENIKKIHKAGYVHRDLSPQNIWVSETGKVYILDLETCTHLCSDGPSIGLGTKGYIAPELLEGKMPSLASDIYSIGCLLSCFFSGISPTLIEYTSIYRNKVKFRKLFEGLTDELINTIRKCLSKNPTTRPRLEVIENALRTQPTDASPLRTVHTQKFNDMVTMAQRGLVHDTSFDTNTNLWLSAKLDVKGEVYAPEDYIPYRFLHRGVSGVLYLMAKLKLTGCLLPELRAYPSRITDWLLKEPKESLPGLFFGEAGVAVSLSEAVAAGLIQYDRRVQKYIQKTLNMGCDLYDITHGMAGQGLAALYISEKLDQPKWRLYAKRNAEVLVDTQREDGSWELAFESEEDRIGGWGFAHGVAGIIHFLSEYDRIVTDKAVRSAWRKGVAWLLKNANETNGALSWIPKTGSFDNEKEYGTIDTWWCNGSFGITLTFDRLYEWTHEETYAEIIRKVLKVNPFRYYHRNLSVCHGLTGIGEVYLEAYRTLRDPWFFEVSARVASLLKSLARKTKYGGLSWLAEGEKPTADLMVGCSGIIHFFLRMNGARFGFPAILSSV